MRKREPRQSGEEEKSTDTFTGFSMPTPPPPVCIVFHCCCTLEKKNKKAHFHIYNRCAHINDQEHNFVLSLRINNTMDIQNMKKCSKFKD